MRFIIGGCIWIEDPNVHVGGGQRYLTIRDTVFNYHAILIAADEEDTEEAMEMAQLVCNVLNSTWKK